MNILIVIADLGLGGAQQVVINLANELSKQKHKVTIYDVYPRLRKEGMINNLNRNIELISTNFHTEKATIFSRLLNSFFYRTGINKNFFKKKKEKNHKRNLLKKINQFDVINSHVWWADKFVYENLLNFDIKWWITFHASYSNIILNKTNENFPFKIMESAIDKATGIIYLSDNEKDIIQAELKFKQSNFNKIYNGIPEAELDLNSAFRKSNNLNKNDFVILCASRAIKEKGWEELIEAIVFLKNKNIKLLLAGDGPNFKYLYNKYKNIETIRFLGYRNDIMNLINCSDIIVSLSYYTEALPTILIESLFLKKPIIATDVAETKHIVKHKNLEAGILLNKKPTKNEVCAAIEEMLDKSRYENFSKNTELIKKQFEVERMANEYLKCFNE